MAQRLQRSLEASSQGSGTSDINLSNFHTASQSCSMYSSQHDEITPIQSMTSENDTGAIEKKPALPPKPSQGPPSYREPPTPPMHENHPDICINSAPPARPEPKIYTPENSALMDRPERQRTQAWVQEHKTSGKLVGEKLSSLQRKLRSLLTQSKDSTDIEKGISIEEKPAAEERESWNFHSSNEPSQRPKSSYSGYQDRLSYLSSSTFGSGASASLSSIHSYNHPCRTAYLPERHPFGAPVQDETADAEQLRDACNKYFSREQRTPWSNYLSPRNCYNSNNIKSTYDHDKLVPKEAIGRPSQEKRSETYESYSGVAPFPSFSRSLNSINIPRKEPEPQGSYFARRVENFAEETKPSSESIEANKAVVAQELEPQPQDCSPTDCGDNCGENCVDINDFYKSSSESGRGTMHSSMHGSKSVVSPHSSGVSAASNLDTSLDSDHSINGTPLWDQQTQEKQVRHIYETPNATLNCSDHNEDDATSESLSVTPPLPPASPAPSPHNSPNLSKYKLSLSASALNKANDQQQKLCEIASSKKLGVRRTTSINQATCKHRSAKTFQCSKGSSSSTHRLGISHGNTSSKKCSSSPPSRHHSRNQLAYPYYLDNVDPELTSTTTGLDMESLLDEADDYSTDLSASASTMEASEVNMIRKQLEGLETMYSEILRLLGVKNSGKDNVFSMSGMSSGLSHSRRRINDNVSSSRSTHHFSDKRGFSEKRRMKSDCRLSKRLQRLESHVVTLARSVAHLSSEMRTQHILVQELENMRQDISWVQERMRLMQLAQGCSPGNAGRNPQLAMPRDWDHFHREVLELLNPCRAKKLTKFFGDEPPLIRQFLKRLGYEKYAVNFENEKIGIKELPYLTEERLQKMGIPMGPRIRILQEAHACCQQNQYKVYIV